MRLRLFGIVRAGHPRAPQQVAWEDLAMVVGDADRDVDPAAHLVAVSALVEHGPVLPVRFGTIAADEDAVRTEILAPSAERFRADLDRLDGLAEVHIGLRCGGDQAWRPARGPGLPAAVSELARDLVRLPPGEHADERWALLIEVGDLPGVRKSVAALDGLHAECVGPLPAYSFLDRRAAGSRWGF